MRVAIVTAVYPPEPFVSARIARDLAMYLAEKGNEVTVWCPLPSRPAGASYAESGDRRSVTCRSEDNVTVLRLPSYRSPKSKILGRAWESYSFGRSVCQYLQSMSCAPDVVYASTWPMIGPALLARYSRRTGVPLVLHLQDLYPESLLLKLPKVVATFAAPPLFWLDRHAAERARRIVAISERMSAHYRVTRGLSEEKLIVIRNWQDEALFAEPINRREAARRYGVAPDRFTFMYLGNMGPVAGVDFLIRAFHAANLPNAQLVLAGGGAERPACEQLVRTLNLKNAVFVSDPDIRNVPLMQSLADIFLLPMKAGAALSSVPSKLPAYLLSAKPVLATVDAESDTAAVIAESGCGWVGMPERLEWLSNQMSELIRFPRPQLEAMGQAGRLWGLNHLSRSKGVSRLADAVLGADRPTR